MEIDLAHGLLFKMESKHEEGKHGERPKVHLTWAQVERIGMFILEERRLRRDTKSVFKYLK